MKKNWRTHQTNDMLYPFCIIGPRIFHKNPPKLVFDDGCEEGVHQLSGSFLTKKEELSFGEADSQRRNPLGLSIKNTNTCGTVCTSKNMSTCGTE